MTHMTKPDIASILKVVRMDQYLVQKKYYSTTMTFI